jgi:carbonic anhydrase/acetyltransferase-like protein (isoleucine patch superfamily)
MMILSFDNVFPQIDERSFVAASADIIGDVTISEDASIWFGSVLRGDGNRIFIGKGTNIQDNCIVHINPGEFPTIIGENVTVGHGVIVHGAKIGNKSLIGMGSIILDGAEIGENTIIGAGSLVPQGKKIPSGVLCMGSPAKVIRELSSEETGKLMISAEHYINLSKKYK